MEAAALGAFMISACLFTVLLEHPMSAANRLVGDPLARRALMGLTMGGTAVALICSPFGKRSGAHMNPAVTLAFLALGKVAWQDAVFYIAAQFAGGAAGVQIAEWLLGLPIRHSSVNYAATVPGSGGEWVAFAAEAAISSALFMAVLTSSNSRPLSRWTPFIVGLMVALFITVEAPISGMSVNPARSAGSAIFAGEFTGLWIYFTAPVAGMLAAAWVYTASRRDHRVLCAKLHHHNSMRCIFRCNVGELHGKH